jgi:hypothetical protein
MPDDSFDRTGKASAPQDGSAQSGNDRKAGIREAKAQVKSGQTIPAKDVEAWIESWDTPDELPMPRPRRH